MKLLYITNGITGSGGLERVLSIKASYLADKMGYEIHIITLNETNQIPFFQFSQRVIIHNITTQKGISYFSSYIKSINQIVKKTHPHIISVCDDGLKGLYVPLWINKGNSKIIYERHASMHLNGNMVSRFFMRLGGYLYDKVIVLTNYNKTEWSSKNVIVIPNPISFIPTQVSTLSNHQIICVGSISYNKGYDLLIKAWAEIAHQFPTWCIHIYGKGDPSIYNKQINDAGISKQIQFYPPTQNINKIYQQASILVLPSRSEGFGMVLIEAMAYGIPCISFDCPCGPRDIIAHGVNGFLVEPNDTKSLSVYISYLISNKKTRIRLGNNALNSISKYSISKIANIWHNTFVNLK